MKGNNEMHSNPFFSFEKWNARDELSKEELEKEMLKLESKLQSRKEENEGEKFLNSFWNGIYLQYLSTYKEKHGIEKEIENKELIFKKMKFKISSLSNDIKEILSFEYLVKEEQNNLVKEGFLNWELFNKENFKIFDENVFNENKTFLKMVNYLKKSSFYIRNYLENIESEKFVEKYGFCDEIFQQTISIKTLFDSLKKEEEHTYILLNMMSYIERTLVTFVRTIKPGFKSKKLSKIFQRVNFNSILNESQVVLYKNLLSSDCIRNYLWHGFISKGEIDPLFVFLLFFVFLSFLKLIFENIKKYDHKLEFSPLKETSIYDKYYSRNEIEIIFQSKKKSFFLFFIFF